MMLFRIEYQYQKNSSIDRKYYFITNVPVKVANKL